MTANRTDTAALFVSGYEEPARLRPKPDVPTRWLRLLASFENYPAIQFVVVVLAWPQINLDPAKMFAPLRRPCNAPKIPPVKLNSRKGGNIPCHVKYLYSTSTGPISLVSNRRGSDATEAEETNASLGYGGDDGKWSSGYVACRLMLAVLAGRARMCSRKECRRAGPKTKQSWVSRFQISVGHATSAWRPADCS